MCIAFSVFCWLKLVMLPISCSMFKQHKVDMFSGGMLLILLLMPLLENLALQASNYQVGHIHYILIYITFCLFNTLAVRLT